MVLFRLWFILSLPYSFTFPLLYFTFTFSTVFNIQPPNIQTICLLRHASDLEIYIVLLLCVFDLHKWYGHVILISLFFENYCILLYVPMLLHVYLAHYLWLLHAIICVCHVVLILSSTGECLESLQILAIKSHAMMNMLFL